MMVGGYMKQLKLRTKLLTAGLLALAVPVVVIGIVGVTQSMRSITELARNRMGNTTQSLAGALDLILKEQIAKIRDIADSDSVVAAAETAAEQGGKNNRNTILIAQRKITKIKNAEGDLLESIVLIGMNRIAFASSDNGKFIGLDLTGRHYLDLAFQGEPSIGSVVFSRATGKVICIAVSPIYAPGGKEIIGAVAMDMELKFLTGIIDEIGVGKSGYAFLVNQAGLFITHPDEKQILKGDVEKIKGMETMLADSQRGIHGVVEYQLDGVRQFAAFAPVPINGWTVVYAVSEDDLYAPAYFTRNVIWGTGIILFPLALIFFLLFARSLTGPLIQLSEASKKIAGGDFDVDVNGESREDEIGTLARAFHDMAGSLGAARREAGKNDWLKTGIARLNEVMRGDPDVATLSAKVIAEMAQYLGAQVGALYTMGNSQHPSLSLTGSYAYRARKNLSNVFKLGEGLVGQAALEKQQILIKNIPDDYIRVTSGLGEGLPRFICVTPFLYEDRIKGVVELGTFNDVSEQEMEYLAQAMPALATAVESAHARTQLAAAFEESQRFGQELQVQQEELRAANEELEEQTKRLQESEEALKAQQEELRVINEELEEKNELLGRQKQEVEAARSQIQEKAEEVAMASKYKSEFLANMSHELRTPLNSLLLLAQNLAQNKAGNLTEEQVESVRVIHESGSDLLSLINEILDLSKIEAGRMDLRMTAGSVSDLCDGIRAAFGHVAREKGLALEIDVEPETPDEFTTDIKRAVQVIRNLISNAIKFTEEGHVAVTFGRPAAGVDLSRSGLDPAQTLKIEVRDTGIGVAQRDHKRIFEAFQQSDGGTARKYSGTGLGLSISRELAHLLGGEIQLRSEPGLGSTFTFYFPIVPQAGRNNRPAPLKEAPYNLPGDEPGRRMAAQEPQLPDDRNEIAKGDHVILVIEDDPKFAKVLYDTCHERRFKCLIALTGETGLRLSAQHLPDGIVLDIRMPGMDGWAVLDALKNDMRTRHIPVHVISVEEAGTESLRKGAVGHATKPLTREELEGAFEKLEQISAEKKKRVLLVEDDEKMRRTVKLLIGDGDVKVDEAATGDEALQAMRTTRYGCLVLDLGLPDINGIELLARMEREGLTLPPVIVHTSRDLTEQEEFDLRGHAESIVIKDVRSQERLLDEVSLFLHRVVGKMPEKKKQMIRSLHETDALLKEKKVLIVDDDMRTTFAVSRLLTEHGVIALKAGNGKQALEALAREPDVDLVLMDIMMPLMDGYETMQQIRRQDRFRRLPIIALTAKAMPDDRLKCIEAGASDYLPKPVDQDRLVSMMRVWLYR
jgi:signal transduction histidine kinase/DNA-binding response OmpR family regulator/HAMP domain-containing protein